MYSTIYVYTISDNTQIYSIYTPIVFHRVDVADASFFQAEARILEVLSQLHLI